MKFKSDAQRKAVMSQYSSDRPTMSNASIQTIKQRKYVNQTQPQLDDVYLYNGKLYKVDEKHSDVVFAYDEQGKLHQLDRKTFTANAKLQPKNDEQRTGLKRETKTFYTINNVGKAKYTVNWENSKGQPEIRIFKNKTKRDLFIKELKEDGYNER